MRRRLLIVACCLSSLALGLAASAAPPAKLRVLVTVGGHAFDAKAFWAMFDRMLDVQYTKAELPKDADLLRPGLQKKFDVVAMYDMVAKFSPEQQKAFVALLNEGIGLVSMHHNLGAHRDWPEFTKIVGGKFIFKDSEFDGKKYAKSTWDHDQEMKISVVDRQHPITRGIADFVIHDETYGGLYVAPGVHLLLKTDHPKNSPEIGWTTSYGASRVIYLMLGHDAKAYATPQYEELLGRALHWAAGK